MSNLKQTALYNSHVAQQGEMVNFSGFSMPIRYKETSIIEEHLAVRENVGMFDTSHMGRYLILGNDAKDFLNLLVPRDLNKIKDGMAAYTFLLNEFGGFKDDIIISQLESTKFMLICNAGNREKIWYWLNSHLLSWKFLGKDIELENKSDISAMIAVQGPKAYSIIENLCGELLPEQRFRTKWINIDEERILFSSTGYTGASGGELIIFGSENDIIYKAEKIWKILLKHNVMPCALGSRDTLRLEAGYRLYGNDIDENINLLESGLNFVPFVHFDKPNGFVGKIALEQQKDKIKRKFIGFKLLEKTIARHGFPVYINNKDAGIVLSGTQSPLTKISFGMALIAKDFDEKNNKFQIEIRGKLKDAEAIQFPIYDENLYGINIRK